MHKARGVYMDREYVIVCVHSGWVGGSMMPGPKGSGQDAKLVPCLLLVKKRFLFFSSPEKTAKTRTIQSKWHCEIIQA